MTVTRLPAGNGILTVSILTKRIRDSLEGNFPAVWVRGEIVNCKRQAQSGHIYFSLKDNWAQLDCVIWSKEAARLPFEPKDGLQVEAFGLVTVFEQRGKYQLKVGEMRPAGAGARQLALEALKKKLQAEGLFALERKRPLPKFPRRIGLVTSRSGAAIRDLVTVLHRRWPSIGIVLAPVRVQGEGAAQEIVWAIRRFNRYGQVDLLIVGRGGGSAEELWTFNDEGVVRAIVESALPVISAVGHEADTTLADWAADVRAATPSNAAEIAVRDRREIQAQARGLKLRLRRAIDHSLEVRRQRFDHVLQKHGFQRRGEVFRLWRERVEDCRERAGIQIARRLEVARHRLERAARAYGLREFPRHLLELRLERNEASERLERAIGERLAARRTSLATCEARLTALSPRHVLERGYCLVRRPDGTLLRAAAQLSVGDPIRVEFARSDADARIERVRTGEEDGT
jgi:exodeoxyribonuclease VII large subunit